MKNHQKTSSSVVMIVNKIHSTLEGIFLKENYETLLSKYHNFIEKMSFPEPFTMATQSVLQSTSLNNPAQYPTAHEHMPKPNSNISFVTVSSGKNRPMVTFHRTPFAQEPA
jgi:hypothetical protein